MTASSLAVACSALTANAWYGETDYGTAQLADISSPTSYDSGVETGKEISSVKPPQAINPVNAAGWSIDLDGADNWRLAPVKQVHENIPLLFEHASAPYHVHSHQDVFEAGVDLAGIDAGRLFIGNAGQLGLSFTDPALTGQAQAVTSMLMINGYYMVNTAARITPRAADDRVESGVHRESFPFDDPVISQGELLAYICIAGADQQLFDNLHQLLSEHQLDRDQGSAGSMLMPATTDIEIQGASYPVGLRYTL